MIHYIERGCGEPLLLIHGLGNTKELWNSQHTLSEHFRLIIPELRGHGNSNITSDISIRSFVSDIFALLDFLKIDKVHVCGLSLGGIIAQEMYVRRPSQIKSIILCNSVSYTPYYLRSIVLFLGVSSVIYKTEAENARFFASRCIYNQQDRRLMKEAENTFAIKKMTYISSSQSSLSKNYLPFLPFIKIPVLVIGSQQDQVTPVQFAFQTHAFLPNSELFILKECGHLSNIEKKKEFNQRILAFLQTVSTA